MQQNLTTRQFPNDNIVSNSFSSLIHKNNFVNQDTSIRYIVVGMYFGECVGRCRQIYKYNFSDTSNKYILESYTDIRNNRITHGDTMIFDSEKIKLISTIIRQIPKQLLTTSKLTDKFGCPDCTDGGGLYLEFSQGNKIKSFNIDYQTSQLTGEIKKFAEDLKIIIQEINSKTY